MNAAETIQAAIDKLEGLPTSAVPWRDVTGFEVYVEGTVVTELSGEAALLTDAETIVTLHRTIDAQLAILRRHKDLAEAIGEPYPISYEDFGVLALARAILGEDA